MSALENAKTYTGKNLETIFFRPMLSGPSAIDLGVRVLYNMPVPTTVQMWEPKTDILQNSLRQAGAAAPARKTPENHPSQPRESRTGLLGRRLLLAGL